MKENEARRMIQKELKAVSKELKFVLEKLGKDLQDYADSKQDPSALDVVFLQSIQRKLSGIAEEVRQ